MTIGNPNFQPTRTTNTLKLVDLAVGTHVFHMRAPEALTTLAVTSASGTANIEYTYDPERPLFDGVAAPNADWAPGIIARTWEPGATDDGEATIQGPITAIKVTVATAVATVVVGPARPDRKRAKRRRVLSLPGPDSISDLSVWWDVSDPQYVFSDAARLVQITDMGLVRSVTDRSGNDVHATIEADAHRGTWLATGQNGIGTLDCQAGVGGATPKAIETDLIDPVIPLTQPYTVVGCGKIAALHASERHALFSMTQSTGTEMRVLLTGDGAMDLTTIGVGSSDDGHDWSANVGEWWMFMMIIDGTSSGIQYGSNASNTIQDETPAFDGHNASTIEPSTLRFGAGVDGIPNIRSGWDEEIGEIQVYNRLLTLAEKNTLVRYYNNKWNLTGTAI